MAALERGESRGRGMQHQNILGRAGVNPQNWVKVHSNDRTMCRQEVSKGRDGINNQDEQRLGAYHYGTGEGRVRAWLLTPLYLTI